ncbi:amino acid adenylation domain-containing protein (plasmid) [Burkholderia sp. FERM BP-3421]|uniref:amino acid adenylation domain-containing protein n=1 Tax=Burkholderia sp. FERM BP-3421 TaxID=1494466 RepID=UPI002361C0B3|nr:non-ribosomal peptide synthetase [Burkholderia sp. FERM BP-3421]WDD90770.1 amino acid adenylation domain-containing protein [Burkholderia sp. FERM BP-3421]
MNPTLSNTAQQARSNVETMLPLTPTQQGLLFHTLKAPESGVYYEQVGCTFQAALDVADYRRALEAVVARHGVLRTGFLWDGPSKPVQVVFRHVELPWIEEDWRHLDRDEQQRRLAAYREADRRPGFHLSRAPLMRCALFRTGAQCYEFVWSYHHLLLDGWSVQIVLGEALACYDAYRRGDAPALPPPQPYSAFLRWLDAQDGAAAEAFWRARLGDVRAATPLPLADAARPGDASGHGTLERLLDPSASDALQQLARACEVTPSTVIQAAWALLLGRASGRDDVVFGTTVSGRPAGLRGVEQMVGLFVNALPTRVAIDPTLTLGDWFRRLHRQHVEAEAYAYTPLHVIPGWSGVAPGAPLFESLVVFENYPAHAAANRYREQLGVAGVEVVEQTNYPLTVVAIPGERLCLRVHFDRQRLAEASAARLLKMLATLLDQFLRGGAALRVGQVSLLGDEAGRALVAQWNAAARPAADPARLCLHRRFEAQARMRPDAIAVQYDGRSLSYAELERRANRLAWRLDAAGVRGNVPVALAFERGIDSIVAMLAVLKAGAFYVPLDLDHPPERLAWMLDDMQAGVLICDDARRERFDGFGGARLVIDADVEAAAVDTAAVETADVRAEAPPPRDASPTDLCYVIYTSGSTGQPKGVCIEHRNVDHLFAATRQTYGIGPTDVWTQFHSYAFDFSVWEIWGALLHGGRLEVVPYGCSRTPNAFLALLARAGVTMLSQTPTAFKQLLRALDDARQPLPASLRYVFFGGEATIPSQFAACLNDAHGVTLVNLYGITETTVHVTERVLGPGDAQSSRSPVGRPLPGYRVYLLDAAGHPVPPGVPGEIHVGGEGVARGYHNRPELDRARFVADPFAPGARLYRSGDLGRFDAYGELDYLGRIDDQVKIRGFRIELGEVEAALARHPEVAHAAVMVDDATVDGHAQLVGFMVLRDTGRVSGAALRDWLAQRLPPHALPARLIELDAIPLTTNGKLDRRRLVDALAADGDAARPHVAPRNAVEQTLADVFASVLKRSTVGVTDNFFELGGDSILSIQILSAAHKVSIDFSLDDLMQSLTIERLAPRVRPVGAAAPAPAAPAARATPSRDQPYDDAYPLSAMQMAMLANEMRHGHDSAYHNVNDQRLALPFDAAALEAALRGAFERHPALRTAFDLAADDEPLQYVHRRVPLPLTVRDWRGLDPVQQDTRIRDWRAAEQRLRFDVARPPLIRFTVHRLSDDTMHIGVTKHHAILDGWSFNLLLSELISDYAARLAGRALTLTAPASRFREFVEQERAAVGSDALRAWWRARLQALPVTRLTHEPDGDATPMAVPISAEQSARLEALAVRAGASVKSVLLTVHLLALSRITGMHAVTSGVVFNGRSEGVDGDRVLGLFLNSLPLSFDLTAGTRDAVALVRAVQATEMEIFSRRRYPLIELHRQIGTVFDVLFNFTHFRALEEAVRDIDVSEGYATDMTNVPLVVQSSVDGRHGVLRITLVPSRRYFSAGTVGRFVGHYTDAMRMMLGESGPAGQAADMTNAGDAARRGEASAPAGSAGGGVSAANAPAVARPHGAALRRELRALWAGVLKREVPSDTADFGALGGDSLLMLRICSRAGRAFGLDAQVVARLLTAQTVAEQARMIETDGAGGDGAQVGALVALSAPGDAPPLFFAPGAGGQASYLRALAAELPDAFAVWGMALPGPDEGGSGASRVESIAAALLADIRRVQPSGPYRLGGHSFGGWVAFEIARQLREQGEAVDWVAVVDSLPPGLTTQQSLKWNWSGGRWVAEIGNSFARLADAALVFDEGEFDGLDDARQVERLRARLIEAGIVPDELGLSEFAARVRAFIAHSLTDYAPATRYAGALRVIVAADDPDRDAGATERDARVDGWRAAAAGEVAAIRLPGDHVGIMRAPFVAGLAAALRAWPEPRAVSVMEIEGEQ